jgi:hypothetical protein
VRGPNDSPEVQEGFLIHLVPVEQIGVIAEIAQEPIQLPERSFGAIQPTREGSCGKRFRLENDQANGKERFLGMPAIGSSIDSNEEQALEKTVAILVSRMQTGNVSFHGFASTGWA